MRFFKEAMIAAFTIMFLACSFTVGILTTQKTISSNGQICFIGLQSNVSQITWGSLVPGGVYTQNIMLTNTGTVSEVLSMVVNNWQPSNADSFVTFSWNKEGTVLGIGASVTATLTCVVSSVVDISGFSNNIVILGVQL